MVPFASAARVLLEQWLPRRHRSRHPSQCLRRSLPTLPYRGRALRALPGGAGPPLPERADLARRWSRRRADLPRVGPADGFDGAVEVARLGSGETEVVIHADADGRRRDAGRGHAAGAGAQRGARAPQHPARAPGRAGRRRLPAPGAPAGGPAALLGAFDRGDRAADPRLHGRGVLRLVGLPLPARRRRLRAQGLPLAQRPPAPGADRPRRARPGAPRRQRARSGADDVGGGRAGRARAPSWWCRSTPAPSGWRCWCSAPGSATSCTGGPSSELAGTLSFAAAIALKNSELVEQLHSAATTDELTGLYNRRALEERLGGRDLPQPPPPAPHQRAAARPRPLQGDQRHHGPRRGRPAAGPGGPGSSGSSAARSTWSAGWAATSSWSSCR